MYRIIIIIGVVFCIQGMDFCAKNDQTITLQGGSVYVQSHFLQHSGKVIKLLDFKKLLMNNSLSNQLSEQSLQVLKSSIAQHNIFVIDIDENNLLVFKIEGSTLGTFGKIIGMDELYNEPSAALEFFACSDSIPVLLMAVKNYVPDVSTNICNIF